MAASADSVAFLAVPVIDTKWLRASVIDEAGQATEPAVVGILRRSDHVVLCGTRSLIQRLGQRLDIKVKLLECYCQGSKVGTFWRNQQEITAVGNIVTQLLFCSRNQAAAMSVITPYTGQMQSLEKVLPSWIRVGCVDAFQGSEQAVSYTHLTLPTKA